MLNKFLHKENNIFSLVFILLFVITALGLNLDLIEPDAALYATISKTIAENNDYINLYSLGYDWLDKPHLPFWLTAISFKIFGFSNFAYKLPAVLIFFFGIWVTYKFTQKNYNTITAILASLILATATHSVISNFDIKAEPYLTSFIIASLYYVDLYIKNKKFYFLIFACFFTALAIMTKGVFAMIPIVAALGGEFIAKRNWKQFFSLNWLVAIFLIGVFIIPELYALYHQFDMHPEKIIFNTNNVSGIRFFFWDSQFGRFFNTAPIKGSGDKLFFFHTILWAFLPWGILYYMATFYKVKRNIKKVIKKEEFYTLFGSLVTILIFSLSKFQLAHYTNIVFPFMAILVADFIYKLDFIYKKIKKSYTVILWFQNCIAVLLVVYLFIILGAKINYIFFVILVFSIIFIKYIYNANHNKTIKLFVLSIVLFLNVYSFLFTHLYPTILTYQGGVTAAKYINKSYNGKGSLINNKHHNFGFEFYLENTFKRVDSLKIHQEKGRIFYLDKDELKLFKRHHIKYQIIKKVNRFRVSKINIKFLNKNTRKQVLDTRFLVKIK